MYRCSGRQTSESHVGREKECTGNIYQVWPCKIGRAVPFSETRALHCATQVSQRCRHIWACYRIHPEGITLENLGSHRLDTLPARLQLNRYFEYQNVTPRCLSLLVDLASDTLSSEGDIQSWSKTNSVITIKKRGILSSLIWNMLSFTLLKQKTQWQSWAGEVKWARSGILLLLTTWTSARSHTVTSKCSRTRKSSRISLLTSVLHVTFYFKLQEITKEM